MNNIVGLSMIAIPALILLIGLFKKNENFFDLRNVFKSHFLLFKNSRLQYLNFYILPLIMAIGVSTFYVPGNEYYAQQNVILSIFISLLITILSIIVSKNYGDEKREKVKVVLEETSNAIVFSVCLCVFLMVLSLIMIAINNIDKTLSFAVGVLSYYMLMIILLNMLLIIKRLERLIKL